MAKATIHAKPHLLSSRSSMEGTASIDDIPFSACALREEKYERGQAA